MHIYEMPPWESAQVACSLRAWIKSPKSCEFPVDAIVTYSMLLRVVPPFGFPPDLTPLIEFDIMLNAWLMVSVKSPKSCAFPAVAMVI